MVKTYSKGHLHKPGLTSNLGKLTTHGFSLFVFAWTSAGCYLRHVIPTLVSFPQPGLTLVISGIARTEELPGPQMGAKDYIFNANISLIYINYISCQKHSLHTKMWFMVDITIASKVVKC